MKIVIEDTPYDGLKEYLLEQNGILECDIKSKDYICTIDIKNDDNITPDILLKYIALYQDNDYDILVGFDKNKDIKIKKFRYVLDEICCDYCYRSLITILFENECIKSVKTNYTFQTGYSNIIFNIEYENIPKEEIIKIIEENK